MVGLGLGPLTVIPMASFLIKHQFNEDTMWCTSVNFMCPEIWVSQLIRPKRGEDNWASLSSIVSKANYSGLTTKEGSKFSPHILLMENSFVSPQVDETNFVPKKTQKISTPIHSFLLLFRSRDPIYMDYIKNKRNRVNEFSV